MTALYKIRTKWKQDFQAGKINKTDILSFTDLDAEVAEIIPVMTEVMTEAEVILHKGHMIETGKCILDLEVDSEVIIIPDGYTEGRTNIEMEVIADTEGGEVNPLYQLEDLELHQGLPVTRMAEVSAVDNLVILPKIVLGKEHREEILHNCKGYPHLCSGNPEEW